MDTLTQAIAHEIRQRVQLRFGPNSRDILNGGGAVALNYGEADEAAKAAVDVIERSGYALVKKETAAHYDEIVGLMRHSLFAAAISRLQVWADELERSE